MTTEQIIDLVEEQAFYKDDDIVYVNLKKLTARLDELGYGEKTQPEGK